jgi:recombinational DNA repair ATPase RecF
MIQSARIQNFQSLVDTTIEFGTLTVILGPNDLGKSATFRAIRAAAETLAGTDFITYGKPKARVEIKVDGQTLIWEKGQKENRYYIVDAAGETHTYEKIGRETPPDVANLLQLGAVEYDRDLKLNLNFADQDDPPFLIPLTPTASVSTVS